MRRRREPHAGGVSWPADAEAALDVLVAAVCALAVRLTAKGRCVTAPTPACGDARALAATTASPSATSPDHSRASYARPGQVAAEPPAT